MVIKFSKKDFLDSIYTSMAQTQASTTSKTTKPLLASLKNTASTKTIKQEIR
jgi:hypothetical protein